MTLTEVDHFVRKKKYEKKIKETKCCPLSVQSSSSCVYMAVEPATHRTKWGRCTCPAGLGHYRPVTSSFPLAVLHLFFFFFFFFLFHVAGVCVCFVDRPWNLIIFLSFCWRSSSGENDLQLNHSSLNISGWTFILVAYASFNPLMQL